MKRIQTLIQSLLLVSALTFSGSAYAGFNFGANTCDDGNGTFTQNIAHNEAVEVGVIPVEKADVKVTLTSPVDVDLQLIDVATNTKIVHWEIGVVNGHSASCATYESVEYCYSGYAGVDGKPGHEYIHINGVTNRDVKMLAFGYAPGDAQVDYSWKAPTGCVDAGSGQFEQALEKDAVAHVGTLPAGKKNIEVTLESDADVDIEIYHGEKAIVAWNCASKANHANPCLDSGVAATLDYEGMTLSYSGYGGVDGQAGHEFIKIEGELTQPLTVKAFAYAAGTATVKYSWGVWTPTGGDSDSSALADDTSAPVAGDSTPSNTPDPASYCGDNMGFDSGINMCIIQPEYTAAKDQCDADLTAANAAKSSCESAKLNLDSKLADSHTANSFCESAKLSCHSDLAAANTAKTSCESTLAVAKGEKTEAMSDLATCQFDLTEAQAVESLSGITNNCTPLDTPANGTTVFTDKGLNSSQTFACDADYQLEGSASLGCTLKQQTDAAVQFGWNQAQPSCLRVCSEPMKPTNGFVTKTKGNLEGSVLSYTCDTGYLIEGTENGSTCQADGTWSLGAPTCQKEDSLAEVIVYQYEEGPYNAKTGKHDSTLKGDDGSVVNCQSTFFNGGWFLKCDNQQLKGRIAIYGLAENINQLYFEDNSITSIEGLDRTGSQLDSAGVGMPKGLTISLGNPIGWLPSYGNLTFDGGCPNGLTRHPWTGEIHDKNGGFMMRHGATGGDYHCK